MKKNVFVFQLLLASFIYAGSYFLSEEPVQKENELIKLETKKYKKVKPSLLKKALLLRENKLP